LKKVKVVTFIIVTIIAYWSVTFSAQPEETVIIHWNDFHAANVSYKPFYENPGGIFVGGYANLAGYIDSLKGIYPEAITLNAGDDYQGSPISSITKGMSQILILNKVMPTVFTIGNHEFDYGVDDLKNALNTAKFHIVSSNIYDSTKSGLLIDPYIIVHSGKVRIAVIGFILKDLKQSVLPEAVKGMEILDPLKTVSKYVKEVNDKSDLIVVLSHNGFEYDSLLALQLSEIDLIIGGHSHTILHQPVVVNDILVCQAGSHGRFVGLLDVKVNIEEKIDQQGGIIPIGKMNRAAFDNVLLLGDSACQVKATTGSGIVMLLSAAKHAASCIERCFQASDFSIKFIKRYYVKPCLISIGKQLKLHYIIRIVFEKFTNKDFESFFQIIKNNNIEEIISFYGDMDFPRELIFQMLKNPIVIKFLLRFILRNPITLLKIIKILL